MFKKVKRRRPHRNGASHPSSTRSQASGGSDASSGTNASSIYLKSCLRITDDTASDGGCSSPSSSMRQGDSVGSDRSDRVSRHSASRASQGSASRNGSVTTSATPKSQRTPKVQFKHVQVREFERVIGDNPSCSSGAPVSIGWAYGKDRVMPLNDYESARPSRRSQNDLILTRQDREELLIEWGATFSEIIESIRANIRAKNQRRRTVNNLGTYDKWEEAMESASRKLKRTLLLQKPSGKRAEQMLARSEQLAKLHGGNHGPITYRIVHSHAPHPQQVRAPGQEGDGNRNNATAENRSELSGSLGMDRNSHEKDSANRSSGVSSVGAPPSTTARRLSRCRQIVTEPAASGEEELHTLGVDESDVGNQHHSPRQSLTEEEKASLDMLEIANRSLPILEVAIESDQQSFVSEDGSWRLTSSVVDGEEFYFGGMYEDTDEDDADDFDADLAQYGLMQQPVYQYMNANGVLYPIGPMNIPVTPQQNIQVPVVISEDGHFDSHDCLRSDVNEGFTMQPPPFSNSIVSKWE